MSVKPELETEPSSPSPASSKALELDEWERIRGKSLQVGGFGEERARLWPKLLNAQHHFTDTKTETEPSSSHKDERQIRLDTDRSFVLYPVDVVKDRETLQEELYQLLVELFRRRPKLSYFQGYHDIITVLFLTLPPDVRLVCAEKISLHRVRDSMGSSLEPVLGLLRFMKNLIGIADPEYAEILEESIPLPYFALSNLLTLFSHDMPTLPLIQHVFDYLLCRPPVMVVYLATAITLSRKAEVQQMQEEGEAGMLHSLLTGLPNITDGDEVLVKGESSVDDQKPAIETAVKELSGDDEYIPLEEETKPKPEDPMPFEPPLEAKPSHENSGAYLQEENPELREDTQFSNPPSDVQGEQEVSEPSNGDPQASSEQGSPSSSSSVKNDAWDDDETFHIRKPTIPLVVLLKQADDLYKTYPPNHPGLSLSSIMGPKSVVFTWSPEPSEMPDDDTAENIVEHTDQIVLPYVEESPDKEKEAEHLNRDNRRGRQKHDKALRRLIRALEFRDRRTMVASAVLVLGVALAVYGIANGSMSRNGRHQFTAEQWRHLTGWVGGVLLGAGERVFRLEN
ncbi:GTPase-activating protein gyp8 [Stygiomarasmius scandens]|uniref:GTPase-activating protein gyp8 n=1 Tax=Marasmiellus scandens TaxID=2682957 RepID=A0ABR1K2G8_9AGAR